MLLVLLLRASAGVSMAEEVMPCDGCLFASGIGSQELSFLVRRSQSTLEFFAENSAAGFEFLKLRALDTHHNTQHEEMSSRHRLGMTAITRIQQPVSVTHPPRGMGETAGGVSKDAIPDRFELPTH